MNKIFVKHILILTLLLSASCARLEQSIGISKNKRPKSIDPLIELAIKDLQVTKKENIYPGHARRIEREIPKVIFEHELDMKLRCNEKDTKYRISGQKIIAYVSNNYNEPGDFSCFLTLDGHDLPKAQTIEIFKLKSVDYKFRVEKLNVAKKHIDLAPKDVERWKKERDLQIKIYGSSVKYPLFNEPFMIPLRSKVTSPFGVKRLFNNKKSSWHSGTDYRAPTGTPIPSANRGGVAYAGDFFFNGGIVIIDHGMDIFTMYCHLSKVLAKTGEIVPKGAVIGHAGSTGRSNGPHLHWGVKVQGDWVSGIPFTKEI